MSQGHESVQLDQAEFFGRYRIIKLLGQGNMGAVYLARDPGLDRQIALKIPHNTHDDTAETLLERFYREARAAAALDHPNICPIYDIGESDGQPYLAMAYIEGPTLSEVLQHEAQTPAATAKTMLQLARALHEAHIRGVIHRDLKPSNIIINRRREPIVMDFGLARNIQDIRITQTGEVLGSPAYMSPEQVKGDADAIGPGTDIYCLGVILYEMLTGCIPFDGRIESVLGQILHVDPVAPSVRQPDVPAEAERICLKAMQKRVEERYESMEEMAQDLDRFLGDDASPKEDARRVAEVSDLEETARTFQSPLSTQPVRIQTDLKPHGKQTGRGKSRLAGVLAFVIAPCLMVAASGLWLNRNQWMTANAAPAKPAARQQNRNDSQARIVAPRVNQPPEILSASTHPPSPIAGEDVSIVVRREDPDGDRTRLEYRPGSSGDWIKLENDVLRFEQLKPGDVKLEVRAVDKHGASSAPQVVAFSVTPPNRLPSIELVGSFPESPTTGQPFTIRFRGSDPDEDFVSYQYRIGSDSDWRSVAGNQVVIDDPQPGPLTVEFRAKDERGGVSEVKTLGVSVGRPNRTPSVRIATVDPLAPVPGDQVTIQFAADDPDGDTITIEFRPTGSVEWEKLIGNTKTLTGLQPGSHRFEFRAVDPGGEISEPTHHDLKVPEEFTNSIDMALRFVPPGKFMMGSRDSPEAVADEFIGESAESFQNEHPRTEVTITKPMLIGKHEVTMSQFHQFVEETNYVTDAEKRSRETAEKSEKNPTGATRAENARSWREPGHIGITEDHPVTLVSWNDAQAFCRWLGRREGKRVRLLTQAEWEYSCRAGTQSRYWTGDDPNSLVAGANVPNPEMTLLIKLSDPFGDGESYGFTVSPFVHTVALHRGDGRLNWKSVEWREEPRDSLYIHNQLGRPIEIVGRNKSLLIPTNHRRFIEPLLEPSLEPRMVHYHTGDQATGWKQFRALPGEIVGFRIRDGRWEYGLSNLFLFSQRHSRNIVISNVSSDATLYLDTADGRMDVGPNQHHHLVPGLATRHYTRVDAEDGFPWLAPVGQLLANEFGLHDMHGNAWEWCQDGFYEYSGMPQLNPTGPEQSDQFVLRGGCFL